MSRYRQVILQADMLTANGRVYPKEVLEKAIADYKARPRMGPVDAEGKVRLANASFEVKDIRMEGDKVVVEVDLFRNLCIAELLRRKQARLTPVGYGTVTGSLVREDYILTGFGVTATEDCTTGEDGEFIEADGPIASLVMDGFGNATDEELLEMLQGGQLYRPYVPMQITRLECSKGVPGCKCAVGFKPEEQCPDCREDELRDSYCVCSPKD